MQTEKIMRVVGSGSGSMAQARSGERRRSPHSTGVLWVAVAAMCAAGSGAAPNGKATRSSGSKGAPADAAAEVRAIQKAYNSVRSLTVKTSADMRVVFRQVTPAHQMSVLKYRRVPAGMRLDVQDPFQGTQSFVDNGVLSYQYNGATNQYSRKPSSPDLPSIAKNLNSVKGQMLSPITFLCGPGVPKEFASLRVAGRETVSGRPTIVLKGELTDSFLMKFAKGAFETPYKPVRKSFTLWVDAATHFLKKMSLDLEWNGRSGPAAASVWPNPRITATETTTQIEVNSPLSADDFQFTPPRGAVETTK